MESALKLTEIVALVTVVISLVGILANSIRSRKAQDLQVFLSLSQDFRSRWDEDWSAAIRDLKLSQDKSSDEAQVNQEVYSMLNWMDWFGHLLKSGLFRRSDLFIQSVGPNMREVLSLAEKQVAEQESRYGYDHWKGLRHLESKLDQKMGRS